MSEEESETPEETTEDGGAPKVPWVILIVVLLITPIITIAGVQFVMVPMLKKSLQGEQPAAVADAGKKSSDEKKGGDKKSEDKGGDKKGDDKGGKGGDKGGGDIGNSFKFENLVTNLSGTMGSRFLKTSFELASEDVEMRKMIQNKEAQVQDAIMGVMSSRTLQELEAIGGRNALRVSLIEAVNKALGIGIVEELYFIELIVQ